MSNLYADYETDLEKEKEGTWVDLSDDRKVLLARWMNDNHRSSIQTAYAPYNKIAASGRPVPEATARKLNIRCMAESIVLGWDGPGWTDRAGKPLPYSRENCIQVLTDLKDLYDQLSGMAQQVDLFKKEVAAAAVGE